LKGEVASPEFDIYEYFYIIKKNLWVLILCFTLVVTASFFYSVFQEPVYESRAQVRIEENVNRASFLTGIPTLLFVGRRKVLQTEIAMIKGYSFAEKVGQNLLAQDIIKKVLQEKNLSLENLKEKLPLLEEIVEKLPYPTKVKQEIKQNIKELLESEYFLNTLPEDQFLVFLTDKSFLLPYSYLISSLSGSIAVFPLGETNIIVIKSKSNHPERAKIIANTYAEIFVKETMRRKKIEAISTREFIAQQLSVVKDRLEKAERKLKLFKQQKGIFSVAEEAKIVGKRMEEFETERIKSQLKVQEWKKEADLIRTQLKGTEEKVSLSKEIIDFPLVRSLRERLVELEVERLTLLEKFTPAHQEVKSIEKQIQQIKKRMKDEVRKALQRPRYQLTGSYEYLVEQLSKLETNMILSKIKQTALSKIIANLEKRMYILPEEEIVLSRLLREKAVNEKIYTMLLTKYEEARIAESVELGDISIVEYACASLKPVKPNLFKNLMMGVVLGILVSIGLLFILQYLNRAIRTNYDVEKHLNLPIMGFIPRISLEKKKKRRGKRKEEEGVEIKEQLVSHFDPKSIVAESYKTMRINMQFANVDQENKTILITSPSPRDGKTTSAANLSITMAQLGEKTLVVEADLRKPVLHKVFDVPAEPGLTNFLAHHEMPAKEIVRPTFIENLYLICAGKTPPNPSILLNSKRLDKLMEELKKDFTNILFDTPPAVMVADAVILASKVDALLMVISVGKTIKHLSSQARKVLGNVNPNILGVIFNNIDTKGQYYYRYHYDYYYHYYSEKES
jgi:tyrosine-protein kinase Etk/Wzc